MPNKYDRASGHNTASEVEEQYLKNCQQDVRNCLAEELCTFAEVCRQPAAVARMQASVSKAQFSFYIGEQAAAAGYDDMGRLRDRLKQLVSAKERWSLQWIMRKVFTVSCLERP